MKPVPSDHAYNPRQVRVVFALASVALLASVAWMVKVEYDRPWHRWQDEYESARHAGRSWVNLPLLDFLAPPTTPGRHAVRQVVAPDVRVDLHFAQTSQTDRCTTCHVAAADRDFPNENQTLRGPAPLSFRQPLLAHPHLDLFVSAGSPHPVARMGCTVCHDGNGEETDFVLAGHTPGSRARQVRWEDQYYVRRAGIVTLHTFDSAQRRGERPILPPRYTESNCTQCHVKVADVAMHEGRPCGRRINEGRFLFTSLGCVNCHLVQELAEARRVGPDLSHVVDKVSRGFLHHWIWQPRDHRPSTCMPHTFLQENNDVPGESGAGDPDPVLRTRVEVVAMSEYLLAASEPAERTPVPPELWSRLQDEHGAEAAAAAERGRRLFGSIGCLGCHAALAYRPDDQDGRAGDPLGITWIGEALAAQRSATISESVREAPHRRAESMTYEQRAEYAMAHFATATETIVAPDQIREPIFTRRAPELSNMRAKLGSYARAVAWLYDWLTDPRHHARDTVMPRMRLARGRFPLVDAQAGRDAAATVEADEALDMAVYLATLPKTAPSRFEPFDLRQDDRGSLAVQRDELLRLVLPGLARAANAGGGGRDEDGELTERLAGVLAEGIGESKARARVAGLDADQRRWALLGWRLLRHYGCSGCHRIAGFDQAPRIGPELTAWGQVPLDRLDFGRFDPALPGRGGPDERLSHLYPPNRHVLIRRAPANPPIEVARTRASFAWHKILNPRIWDRLKPAPPYEKLKMPNFFLTDRQADALVTWLLSRKPSRAGPALQVAYDTSPAGWVADGRNLARDLNCVGCHRIDGNAAVLDQYHKIVAGPDLVFDEHSAAPPLWGEGARVQPAWLYDYLRNVETRRPWLKLRMPQFDLASPQATQLAAYFAGLSQEESRRLERYLSSVRKHDMRAGFRQEESTASRSWPDEPPTGSDWFKNPALADVADALRRYAVDHRLVPARTVDPAAASPEELAAGHAQILRDAAFFRDLLDVQYPFPDSPPRAAPTAQKIADGQTVFSALPCLTCHTLGDLARPGANVSPTAPNLDGVPRRLRRLWVRAWLEGPHRILPGTRMPSLFGTGAGGAFSAYPPADREHLRDLLNDKTLLDDRPGQLDAVVEFLFYAAADLPTKTAPAWTASVVESGR